MSQHPVSVIVVNYNAGPLLWQCARAVLNSSVPVRVFVVDNHSTDESLPLLRLHCGKEENLEIIANAANLGFARANNIAIDKATGKYLLLLNPDCIVQTDTLERMLQVMEQHPEAGMAGCRVLNPDGSEQRGCRRQLPTIGNSFGHALVPPFLRKAFGLADFNQHKKNLPKEPTEVEAISGSFMFVRRQAMRDVGPLDEGYFMHCEDLDWCARFAAKGHRILFVPDVTVIHHQGACSSARPVFVQWHLHKGMARFYDKFDPHRNNPFISTLVKMGIWLRFGLKALKSKLSFNG